MEDVMRQALGAEPYLGYALVTAGIGVLFVGIGSFLRGLASLIHGRPAEIVREPVVYDPVVREP
jgi:hypothetical protein